MRFGERFKDLANVQAVGHRVKALGNDLKVFTIGKKLATGFLIINIITILLGLLNLSTMQRVHSFTRTIIQDQMSPMLSLMQVQRDTEQVHKDLMAVATAALSSQSASDFYAAVANIGLQINQQETTLTDDLQKLSHTSLAQADQRDWNAAVSSIVSLVPDTQNDLNALSQAYGSKDHHAIKLASDADIQKIEQLLNKLLQFAKQQSMGAEQSSRQLYVRAVTISLAGLVLAVLVSVLIVALLIRSVSRSLRSITRQMDDFAHSHGDLTQRLAVKSRDETGLLSAAFNAMMDNIQQLVQRVADSAEKVQALSADISAWSEQVLSGAQEISSASQQIAAGAEGQSAHIHGASSQLNEMVAQLTQLRQAADGALSKAAEHTRTSVAEGQRAVDTVQAHMSTVTDAMGSLSGQMETLKDQAGRIGRIVEMIAEIAAQSRLLALNASIEAARAGEHGRGFSVVALEVRKLADQSRSAALEIQQIVASIQEQVGVAVSTADEAKERVSQGHTVIDTSRAAFARIKEAVEAVAAEIQQTLASIDSVVAEAQLVSERMQEVVRVAENSVANAEEVSAAIEQQTSSLQHTATAIHDLANMADGLKSMIAQFKY